MDNAVVAEKAVTVPILDRMATLTSTGARAIGGAILVLMMLLTAVDVVLRYAFNRPMLGGIELTQFMMAIVVAIGLANMAFKKGHISVDFFTEKGSPRTRGVLSSITTLISMGVFITIAWYSFVYGQTTRAGGNSSLEMLIPVYPFVYIVALGAAVISLILLANLVQYLKQVIYGFHWQALIGLFVLMVLVLAFFAMPIWGRMFWQLNPLTVGILGVIVLIIVLFSGMAVGTSMALIGFLGMAYISGLGAGLGIMGTAPYNQASSYTNTVIPLFVLMGAFCFYSGLSRELYYAAYKWIGHLPGGLAMATIGACTAFSAVSGTSSATSTTIGIVSLPEMRKYKYDSALATGCIAAGGTLGILIPPSVPLVVYGVLTEQSIGKLFLAGFLPGILVAIQYVITIWIVCKRNPLLGMPGPVASWKERIVSLKGGWGVLVLFILVIGGLYAGVFTATEAAGVGAFGAFIFALGTRQLSWRHFTASLNEAGGVTGMVMLILIGGILFGYFLAVTRLPFQLADIVSGLGLNRYIVLLAVIIVYIVLGCFMSSLAMIIITVPVFFPIMITFGFDPIWFGILVIRLVEIGQITPPVGVNVFIIQAIAKDVPMYTIFRGIIPFLISDIINVVILVALPEIVLILPQMMR